MTTEERATQFMKTAHRSIDQRRKYSGAHYEVHPLGVLEIVKSAGITDEDVIVAALLHDVLEDVFPLIPAYSEELIREEFGARAAGFVVELTDVYTKEAFPAINRKGRKIMEFERYATMSGGAQVVKLADQVYNARDTVPEDKGFAHLYLGEKEISLPYLKPTPDKEFFDERKFLWDLSFKTLQERKKVLGLS